MIEIFTDGCSKGNPGKGGYGILLRSGTHEKRLSAGYYHTTNNRMELLGVIIALESLKKPAQEIKIISDSQYVLNYIRTRPFARFSKEKWAKLKNPDLWLRYIKASEGHKITTQWVKGHSGHTENEICDSLATMAANNPTETDHGYLQILADQQNELF